MSTTEDEDLERCQKLVGSTIQGQWRVDALLGIGGMAAVFAATHASGRRDAIKILHPHVAFSKELRKRFEQEALAIGRLGHPGTVQVIAIDMTHEGAPFMAMELLDGESLGQRAYRLKSAGQLMAPMELLSYAERVLEVLAVAHERGIVHRDIKPDNLFITRDGRVKVLDFGIARMFEGGAAGVRTRTGAMIGTTSYMAPEQIHSKNVDGRTDLYGLGATMFRILADRRVHEGETDAELLIKMGSVPAPAIASVAPRVDPRVGAIVDRALAFDRDRRYPNAPAMLEDVRAVLGGGAPRIALAPPGAALPLAVTAARPIPEPPVSAPAPSLQRPTEVAPPSAASAAGPTRPDPATIPDPPSAATAPRVPLGPLPPPPPPSSSAAAPMPIPIPIPIPPPSSPSVKKIGGPTVAIPLFDPGQAPDPRPPDSAGLPPMPRVPASAIRPVAAAARDGAIGGPPVSPRVPGPRTEAMTNVEPKHVSIPRPPRSGGGPGSRGQERRTSLGLVIVIGLIMILAGGGITAIVLKATADGAKKAPRPSSTAAP